MSIRALHRAALALWPWWLLGCGVTYVGRAETAYHDGRYLEVVEDLSSHEAELPRLPPHDRARYGVYRGLSLLELGDRRGAKRWLDYAAELDRLTPALTREQRAQLAAGQRRLLAPSAQGL